jgi:hypothetical protein
VSASQSPTTTLSQSGGISPAQKRHPDLTPEIPDPKIFGMRYIIPMLMALAGVMVVTGLSIKLVVLQHPVWAVTVFFGGFYILRRAFRKYMQP